MSKRFVGRGQTVGGCTVLVEHSDGHQEKLDPRYDEIRHSPDGFQWGYSGSGPAQLAFALLAEVYDAEIAWDNYQQFKNDFVFSLESGEDFMINEKEIKDHMEIIQA